MKIQQFKESGQLVESFLADSQGDLIKDAELFSTGTHRGRNYTESDLQALAESFNHEESVPVQLDHSTSVRDTVGFLESVTVKGNKLMGKLRIVEEDIKKRVANKLAKKVSISFYTDSIGNPTRLREVSIVAFPQLKSAQMFNEQVTLSSRKQELYKKAIEFQRKMQQRATMLAQVEKNKIKLEQARQDEEYYQSYMESINGKQSAIKMTTEDEKYYKEYMSSLGLGHRRL
ncbi:hypothetical protein [Bacillus toyonensis]|uniref:Uncharacterized protein n=1 Tax=Bacillus toyonensis TaxID=155322 RepID=A0AB36T5L3_9BACI|nr:hypothetical protein [Bacillus toyonensis]PEC09598.1 hypothetical protein CON55_18090 [Bacillus toyonensis]PEN88693.1 hypothetical protein CN551_13110 [Bacillus toyonensis]